MQRFVQNVYFEQAPAQRAVRDRVKFPELVEKNTEVSGLYFRYLLQYRRMSFSKIYFILPAISNK